MKPLSRLLFVTVVCPALGFPLHAEVIEEVVAVVNGAIVTKMDLEEQEEVLMSEAYRQYSGAELDENVAKIKETLLLDLIDRRILLSKARMFDIDKIREAYFQSFLEQQNLPSDEEELTRVLANEGMTIEELKQKLVEMFLPEEVLRYEVGSRVSVTDREVKTYYDENAEQFMQPAEVTIREIVLLANDDGHRAKRSAEARKIRADALKTGDLEALARQYSEAGTKDQGGLLGPLGKGDLSLQLEDQAFSMNVGDISPVLQTTYGFHIIQVVSRTDAAPQPFEEVQDRLREYLEGTKSINAYKTFFEESRADAEWCVKQNYMDRLPDGVVAESCDSL